MIWLDDNHSWYWLATGCVNAMIATHYRIMLKVRHENNLWLHKLETSADTCSRLSRYMILGNQWTR